MKWFSLFIWNYFDPLDSLVRRRFTLKADCIEDECQDAGDKDHEEANRRKNDVEVSCTLLQFWSVWAIQMRSYPLFGFLLEISPKASTMKNNPRMLRPNAIGIVLLFLSREHSSSFPNWLPTMAKAWSWVLTVSSWKLSARFTICLLRHLNEFPTVAVNSCLLVTLCHEPTEGIFKLASTVLM